LNAYGNINDISYGFLVIKEAFEVEKLKKLISFYVESVSDFAQKDII
jgi:hypothetical protein